MSDELNEDNEVAAPKKRSRGRRSNDLGARGMPGTFEDANALTDVFEELKDQFKDAVEDIQKKRFKDALVVFKRQVRAAENVKLLRQVFEWERSRRILGIVDEFELNAMEEAELADECECYAPTVAGLFATVGSVYKFKKYFDESRGKDVYVTFVKEIKAPEDQIGKEMAWRIAQGFMPKEEDYPPAKTIVHRVSLVESQWARHFKELV